MVEIEHIQDIEKDQPAKSSAKEQKLKDPKDFRNKNLSLDRRGSIPRLVAN